MPGFRHGVPDFTKMILAESAKEKVHLPSVVAPVLQLRADRAAED